MCVSNEPGFYKDGEYGIRIENVIMVVKDPRFPETRYKFENLTIFPYERRLIDLKLLSSSDVTYLNNFHQQVRTLNMQSFFYSVWTP